MQGKRTNNNHTKSQYYQRKFKIIVVDFIANLKSAIYSKQDYFQYKLLPYLEYPPRSLISCIYILVGLAGFLTFSAKSV
jgi:hypothetical protein